MQFKKVNVIGIKRIHFDNQFASDTLLLSHLLTACKSLFYIAQSKQSKLTKAIYQQRKKEFDKKHIDIIKYSIRLSHDKRKALYMVKHGHNVYSVNNHIIK